ncbi:MAG TPA: retroviral-like aspartic protease family protein [Chloroflexota bacterium]
MGDFSYPMTLIGPGGEATVDALVDTGATFACVPREVLQRFGVHPTRRTRFTLADGRVSEFDVGTVTARVDGDEAPTMCVFGEPGTQPLMGAITLEALLLTADPIDKRLVPRTGNLL